MSAVALFFIRFNCRNLLMALTITTTATNDITTTGLEQQAKVDLQRPTKVKASSPANPQNSLRDLMYDASNKQMDKIFEHYPDAHARVPNIIHFIWVDTESWEEPAQQRPVPSDVLEIINAWQKLHPEWEVILWTNTSTLLHFPELYVTLRSIKVGSWASNLIRYHVLAKYGGTYFDTDIIPLRPIPSSLMESAFTVCERPRDFDPTNPNSKCRLTCNAVIGTPRGNQDIQVVADTALQNTKARLKKYGTKARYNLNVSGPPLLTQVVTVEESSFAILPPHMFYPCDWKVRKKCIAHNFANDTNVIAMHLWKQSWGSF